MLIELTLNVCTTRLAIDHQFAISCDVPFEQFLASLPGCDIETERTVLSLRKHKMAIAFRCGRFSSCFQQPFNWSADRLCAAALASGEKKFCADTAARKTASQKAFNLRC